MMENRLVIEGTMVVHGYKTESVPGSTMKDKQVHLIQSPIEEHRRLMTMGGFRCVFKNGLTENGDCIISLPTGYTIVTAYSNCVYLRWGMSGDASDDSRRNATLKGLLESFPNYKQMAGYQDFAHYLGIHV